MAHVWEKSYPRGIASAQHAALRDLLFLQCSWQAGGSSISVHWRYRGITGTEAFYFFAAGDNHSGRVRSRYVRQRRPHLVTAADHQVVHIADGGGMDVDQNFVRRRLRFGRFTNSQRLSAVEAVAKHRAQ